MDKEAQDALDSFLATPNAKVPVTHGAMVKVVAPLVRDLVQRLMALSQRVSTLEGELAEVKKYPMKYLGPHEQGRAYSKNEFVSFGGSMWHARRDNAQRPGDGDAWVLAVKHGRDSR